MTTVVLAGDGMEELLARVASEHGEGARVVRAERVRVGGVAGFFARQRFELVVEVDDDADDVSGDAAAAGLKPGAPGAEDSGEGAAAPASAVTTSPTTTSPTTTSAATTSPTPAGGTRAATTDTTSSTPGATARTQQHGPQGRDQEEDPVLGHPRTPLAPAPGVPAPRATAGQDRCDEVIGDIFDSPIARALVRANVLDADGGAPSARARGALDHLVDAADAGDDASMGVNGRSRTAPGRPTAADAGVDGAAPRGRHAAPSEPLERGRPVSTESAAFAAVLDAVRGAAEPDEAPTHRDAPATDQPAAPAAAASASEPVAAGAAVAELMALLAARHVGEAPAERPGAEPAAAPASDERRDDVPSAPVAAAPSPAAQAPAAPSPAAQVPTAQAPTAQARTVQAAGVGVDPTSPRARAAAAGLPAALLDRLPADASAGDLHALLEELPVAPHLPSSEGDLVAVVGAPREALVVARDLATRLGLGPEGVLVAACPTGPAAPRREVVRDAVAARRAAATVRLGDAPGVVVVQVECDPQSVRWARGVVSALQADQVHVVVDATRKSADTDRWLDGVFAEEPDALHVVQAAGSGDPATVLELDLPVASLDGGEGGASAWTSLLTRAPEAAPAEPAPARRARRAGR
ncbi:hypothetical protein [uncultured Pseudokineococcus sp.]|uniref:hypothetical protein n=1 Tax=uncultured Pseudokineococcus sp. TaxID=1642928 RepID=UPI00261F4723|nr:hypothetical protein [uncultured Pseudokineococcus sp.]